MVVLRFLLFQWVLVVAAVLRALLVVLAGVSLPLSLLPFRFFPPSGAGNVQAARARSQLVLVAAAAAAFRTGLLWIARAARRRRPFAVLSAFLRRRRCRDRWVALARFPVGVG